MRLDDDLSYRESEIGIVCENGKCTCQATYIVRIHPMDHCNVPQLDVRGDRVFTFCPSCVASVARRIGAVIDITLRCRTCGRHVSKLHDVYIVESLVTL